MALSPGFGRSSSPRDLPQGSLRVLIIWQLAFPRASHPRQQGRVAMPFMTEPQKLYSPFRHVLLVTKTNTNTMWETTTQGRENQELRIALPVSDWAAMDPRQSGSRVQDAVSCCLCVGLTKHALCSLIFL